MKRVAVPEYVNYRDDVHPFWLHLPRLREQLAAQGLHVVTAAEKAVLDAMAESRIDVDGWFIDSITEQAAGLAELARRGAK